MDRGGMKVWVGREGQLFSFYRRLQEAGQTHKLLLRFLSVVVCVVWWSGVGVRECCGSCCRIASFTVGELYVKTGPTRLLLSDVSPFRHTHAQTQQGDNNEDDEIKDTIILSIRKFSSSRHSAIKESKAHIATPPIAKARPLHHHHFHGQRPSPPRRPGRWRLALVPAPLRRHT